MNNSEILEQKNPLLGLILRSEKRQKMVLPKLPFPREETIALYLTMLSSSKWQQKLVQWLEGKKERKIYFVPDNPQILHYISLPLIKHPRFIIGTEFHSFIWDNLFQPWELIGKDAKELGESILNGELTVALYRDFGITQITNMIKNLSSFKEMKNGEDLIGKFQGIPAIICGAGPSLMDSIEEVRKVQDRAMIFGGGSALSPLSRSHIPLHFSVSIDPDPPQERFYKQSYFETPLFFQNQVSHPLLAQHHGPKLCFGRGGSFILEEWLTEEFSLSTYDVGWSVATFATAIAILLGCNPIYFVGVDLCVYKEASYAQGVEGKDLRDNPIQIKDQRGMNVKTRPDFLMSKNWLEKCIRRNPEKTFIQTGDRGLKIKGAKGGPINISRPNFDLRSYIYQQTTLASPIECSRGFKKLLAFDESLKRTSFILKEYLEGLGEQKSFILHQYELEEEPFFKYHLLPLWNVWKHLLQKSEIVKEMKNLPLEQKLQEILFYQDITEKFYGERNIFI